MKELIKQLLVQGRVIAAKDQKIKELEKKIAELQKKEPYDLHSGYFRVY